MFQATVRRFPVRLFVVATMITALLFAPSGGVIRAQGQFGCDADYEYCYTQCQFLPDPDDQTLCVQACEPLYYECRQWEDPPVGQPRRPCPPCLQECDLMALQCRLDGTGTPQQCAFINYRCRQRCNYDCIY